MKSFFSTKKKYKLNFPTQCLTPFYALCAFLLIACLFRFNVFSHVLGTNSSAVSSKVEKNVSEKDFHSFLHQIFQNEVTANTLNLHYTLADPASAEINDYPITFGDISHDQETAQLAAMENLKSELHRFDTSSMSIANQLTYDILEDYLNRKLELAPYFYYNELLSSTNGVQSEYPILLAEYTFHTKNDVDDYLELLSQYDSYFESVCNFEKEKAKQGLFMNQKSVENIIKQCHAFLPANSKESFWETTFIERLNELKDLTQKEKNGYVKQNHTILQEHVYPAYHNLIAVLKSLKKSGKNAQGLCYFKDGKKYYELLVKSSTGSTRSIPELETMVKTQREQNLSELSKVTSKISQTNSTATWSASRKSNTEKIAAAASYSVLPYRSPENILEHLKSQIKTDFPKAPQANYKIKLVNEKLQDFLSPAFYLTAPIDQFTNNCIYINPGNRYNDIELFTTLAHEGYPGHLYQTVYSYSAELAPIRYLLYHGGYTEGWATYVEMLSYNYAGLDQNIAKAFMLNQDATLSLYATIDMGIHYDGWTLADTVDFLGSYGITKTSVIANIYQAIIENPANYLKYYIGYLEFLQLKSQAKEYYGNDYSELLFHKAILDIGSSPFYIINKYLPKYYAASE